MALLALTFSTPLVSGFLEFAGMIGDLCQGECDKGTPAAHCASFCASPPIGPNSYETTAEGCTCTTECGATTDDGFACDWCRVQDGCGKTSLFSGNWDYCVYPALEQFEAQDHKAKMDQVWKDMTAPENVGKSGPVKSPLGVVSQMVAESMRTTMDNHRDVLPIGRTKVIHAQGAHCQFEMTVEPDSPYTGILAPGATSAGIMRLGAATPLAHGQGLFPGMGVKFFRDGVHSANFVVLRATGPTGGSNNYFKGDLSNHVAPPTALQALMKFQQASDCISMVGLSDVCEYTQSGAKVDKVNFPFELLWRGSGEVEFDDSTTPTDEGLLKDLTSIPVGTHVWDVYAKASPKAEAKKLGAVKTTSECVQSIFGDMKLAFKHQRMEADFTLRPEWMPDVNLKACNPTTGPISKWQCPFHQ